MSKRGGNLIASRDRVKSSVDGRRMNIQLRLNFEVGGTMSTSTIVAWLWKNAADFIHIGVVLMVA